MKKGLLTFFLVCSLTACGQLDRGSESQTKDVTSVRSLKSLATVNFDGFSEGTLQVPANYSDADFSVQVTTNAKRNGDPINFTNGVSAAGFGDADNRVFMLRNVGSSSNQRYMIVQINSSTPWSMTSLRLRTLTNASVDPLSIAIEASNDPYFTDVSAFGTVQVTPRSTFATVSASGHAVFDAGVTFLRLRSLNEIPDGSKFIAYDDLEIEGHKSLGIWDFEGLGAGTLRVPVHSVAAGFSMDLSTNAQRNNDPVNFVNGVTGEAVLGSNNLSYILRNVGTSPQQRYPFVKIEAQST